MAKGWGAARHTDSENNVVTKVDMLGEGKVLRLAIV